MTPLDLAATSKRRGDDVRERPNQIQLATTYSLEVIIPPRSNSILREYQVLCFQYIWRQYISTFWFDENFMFNILREDIFTPSDLKKINLLLYIFWENILLDLRKINLLLYIFWENIYLDLKKINVLLYIFWENIYLDLKKINLLLYIFLRKYTFRFEENKFIVVYILRKYT